MPGNNLSHASPTDHAILGVYTTLDDTSEVWHLIPRMEFLIENTTVTLPSGSIRSRRGVVRRRNSLSLSRRRRQRRRMRCLLGRSARSPRPRSDSRRAGRCRSDPTRASPRTRSRPRQGTATNAGVVGEDNAHMGWLKRLPAFHDRPCRDITLAGRNFTMPHPLAPDETVTTGAFSPLGRPTEAGQVVRRPLPCSGAIMRVRPDGRDLELVAWGLATPSGSPLRPTGVCSRPTMPTTSGGAGKSSVRAICSGRSSGNLVWMAGLPWRSRA